VGEMGLSCRDFGAHHAGYRRNELGKPRPRLIQSPRRERSTVRVVSMGWDAIRLRSQVLKLADNSDRNSIMTLPGHSVAASRNSSVH
jgi:hypothetical protein